MSDSLAGSAQPLTLPSPQRGEGLAECRHGRRRTEPSPLGERTPYGFSSAFFDRRGRVEQCAVEQHGAGNFEEPIADGTERPAM